MFIVSEIFPQHSGDLNLAETLILQSKMGGASAVKLQLYKGNQFSNDGFCRNYIELDKKGLKRLVDFGNNINIPVFATAFDKKRLDWVLELNLPFLKIASRMHKESPELVERIVETKKPFFVSIADHSILKDFSGNKNAIKLDCVSKYPTLLEEWKMNSSKKSLFDGISDHSSGISAGLFAASLGFKYIEKHFTLSRNLQKSTEKAHIGAMDFEELLKLKRLSTEIELLGSDPVKILS